MIREPYNVTPYNSTIDTSLVNSYGFTFSGDELGSWKIDIAKNNSSPEILYSTDTFSPEDIGYEHIYDGDIIEGIGVPSIVATNGQDDGLLRKAYTITGLTYNTNVRRINVNGRIEDGQLIGGITIEGITDGNGTTYHVVTTSSIGRENEGINLFGIDAAGEIKVQTTDGEFEFTGYVLTVENNANIAVNDNVQIQGKKFTISSPLDVGTNYTQLTLVATESPIPYFSTEGNVQFYIYKTNARNADYFNTLGEDLIWRTRMWEPNKSVQNFIKRGYFLEKRQVVSTPSPIYAYEGEVSLTVLENSTPTTRTVTADPVYIGNDLFVINIQEEENILYANIMLSPNLSEENMLDFVTSLNGANVIFEIDNYLYSVKSGTPTIIDEGTHISLALQSTEQTAAMREQAIFNLQPNNYYNYYIEGISATYTSYVAKWTYNINSGIKFGVRVNASSINEITQIYYWQYSDGSVRMFYGLTTPLTGVVRNQSYRLYSNFYDSNWYFFQSRKTPLLTLQSYDFGINDYIDFPIQNHKNRQMKLKGSYSQQDGIAVRYHTWEILQQVGDATISLYKSEPIYTSDFNFTYKPLDDNAIYTVIFTVVNQEGVETSISGDLITTINTINLDASCIVEVNENEHVAEITWLNGLGAEPDEKVDNNAFGNRISVGPEGQDIAINKDQLTYSTISGGNLRISEDNFTLRAGLIINDDAKVDGKDDDFYNSNILTLNSQENDVTFNKEGLEIKYNGTSFSPSWKLLDDTFGQVTNIYTNYYLGKNYVWQEGSSKTWNNTHYWAETRSDTNCYYYQINVGQAANNTTRKIQVKRAAYWNGIPNSVDTTNNKITIPYNPLLSTTASNSRVIIYPGPGEDNVSLTPTVYSANTNNGTITFTFNSALPAINQLVVYDVGTSWSRTLSDNNGSTVATYNSFILGPRTNYFYLTIYENYTANSEQTFPDFGVKPSWSTEPSPIINAKFNGSAVSGKMEEMSGAITGYEVYRRKWEIIGYDNIENKSIYKQIYSRPIATFTLDEENLETVNKFKLIDWTIENRGIFDYIIYPISSDISAQAIIVTQEKVTTDWYGWSFTSLDKFPTGHYEPLDRWLFKLNLETNGYAQQTNKVFHQGFNRYPKVSIGTTNYITSSLSCLIGDINKELAKSKILSAKQGYTRDNIDKIKEWEDFTNRSNLILIKDYKGRAYLGIIDGNSASFQDIVVEILTRLSFTITQIDDVTNYSIFSVEEG